MKVIIVDDDKLVCSSLQTILEATGEIQVLGVGYSGNDGIALYNKHQPDLMLMDIHMDQKNGLQSAEEILKNHPNAKIIFLTTFVDEEYIIRALSIGAKGYILKENFATIVTTLKAVSQGQNVFGNDIMTKIPPLMAKDKTPDVSDFGISEKESEIITLVAQGLSNKEIADALFLSEGTVRNYISVILEKLHLRDRTQLAIFYFKAK